jgi:hypothetical protein
MPKDAARIYLRVLDIRLEWLQSISERDARAEGAPFEGSYKAGFMRLWDSINKKRGFAWENNPLVWSVRFETTQRLEL